MASSYLKNLQLMRELEKKAQEATKKKQQAEEEISNAEEIIVAAKKIDANVAKAEAKLTEATSAFSNKDFKLALELATESKELAQKARENHVFMVIESTRNLLKVAKNLGSDVKDMNEVLEKSNAAAREEQWAEALELAKKGWKELDKLLNKKVSDAFLSVQSMTNLAKETGGDISKIESLLDQSRAFIEKSDYERALAFIKECTRLCGKSVRSEISKATEKVNKHVELIKKMEGSATQVDKIKDEIDEAIKKEEFQNAFDLTDKAISTSEKILEQQGKKYIQSSEEGLKNAKMLGADITKATMVIEKAKEAYTIKNYEELIDLLEQAKEDLDNSQFQCVLKVISLSRPKFIKAKSINADLADAMKYLDNARNSLKNKRFAEAIDFAKKGENAVDVLIGDYQKAEIELSTIGKAFSRAAKLGIDVKFGTPLVKEAKLAFDNKDYKKALKLISTCKEKLEGNIYDCVMEKIEAAEFLIATGEKIKIEVEKPTTLLEKAINSLKNKEYENAIEFSKESLGLIEKSLEEGLTQNIESLESAIKLMGESETTKKTQALISKAKNSLQEKNYEDANKNLLESQRLFEEEAKKSLKRGNSAIETLKELGGDTSEYDKMIADAKSAIENKNFDIAIKGVDNIISNVNKEQHKIVVDLFSTTKNAVVEAKNKGMDLKTEIKKLSLAKEAVGKKLYKEAYSLITESKNDTETLMKKYTEAFEAMSSITAQLSEAKKDGSDITTLTKKIADANKYIESHNYDAALTTIEDCKTEIKELEFRRLIANKLNLIDENINAAKSIGLDPSDYEAKLQEVNTLKNKKEYEKAIEVAEELNNDILNGCKSEISEILKRSRSMISEAKKIGLDVLTVEVLIQRAEEAIENGKYEKAGKYALQSLEEIEEVKDETQQAASLIQLVKNYINEAEGLRANTKEARKLYERALAELKNNRYADSIDLSKRAIKLAKEAKKGHVAETIHMFRSIVNKAKEEGLNVTSSTKKINEAQDALKKEKFSEALGLAMQSENEIEQIDLQKKLATDTLSTTLANIKQAEDEGIDVQRASTFLKKATSALKDEDYMIALHWAIESGNEIAYAYEHFEKSSAMLQAAEARIKEGETIGADVGKAKDILKSAQTTVEEKDYESCISYAKEAIKEAKKAYEKQLGQPIEICETLMRTGAEMGVDVSRAENIIREAKVALEEEAYTQVRLYTENSRRLVEKEIRKRLYEILSETKGTEKDDKSLGKDYSEGIALLKKGISALDGKDYSAASDLISKGWKILGGGAVEELVEPESGKPLEKKPEIEEEQKVTPATFSRIKAEKPVKCVVCKGKIKVGQPIIRCRCGFSYHETCGNRVAKCIKCGQKFVTTKVAKKKVALKLG